MGKKIKQNRTKPGNHIEIQQQQKRIDGSGSCATRLNCVNIVLLLSIYMAIQKSYIAN